MLEVHSRFWVNPVYIAQRLSMIGTLHRIVTKRLPNVKNAASLVISGQLAQRNLEDTETNTKIGRKIQNSNQWKLKTEDTDTAAAKAVDSARNNGFFAGVSVVTSGGKVLCHSDKVNNCPMPRMNIEITDLRIIV